MWKKRGKGAIMLTQINEKASSVHGYVVFETEQSAEASLAHNMSLVIQKSFFMSEEVYQLLEKNVEPVRVPHLNIGKGIALRLV
ncbi:unnamed protein product [Brassica oleracea var. botrytis]